MVLLLLLLLLLALDHGGELVEELGRHGRRDEGLTAVDAVVSGRSVTITTAAQLPGQIYTVTVDNTVTDKLGSALGIPDAAQFTGFSMPAVVLISEVNANITSGCDLVELRVISGGSMSGFQLFERITSVITFSGLAVESGDIVVVHFDLTDGSCYGVPPPSGETISVDQHPSTSFSTNYDTAWDWYSTDSGITGTDNVLTLYDGHGIVLDAVFLSDDPAGKAAHPQAIQGPPLPACWPNRSPPLDWQRWPTGLRCFSGPGWKMPIAG